MYCTAQETRGAMAQKVEAHCWYELHAHPLNPEWVVDEEEDDRRLHHPDRMTVVQWGDREPGEGIGDYAPYSTELERVMDCIKFPLPYLSTDEKISFIDEALSRFRAVTRELETERAKAKAIPLWQRLAFIVKVVGPALRESLERMRSIKPGGQAFETAKDSFYTGALKMAGMETGGEGTDKLVPSLPKRARDEFERDFIDDGDGDAPVSEAAEQCAVCCNDDDGVSALQRCDGPCNRWFCIEGSCASTLGVPYDKNLTAGDLVCSACEKLEAKLKMKAATAMAPRLLQASDDQ